MKIDLAAPTSNVDETHESEFREQLERALGTDYTLDALIGEGGFGRVYSATDVRLGRRVAIKVIRPELAGARAFLDRFRKEGTALGRRVHGFAAGTVRSLPLGRAQRAEIAERA